MNRIKTIPIFLLGITVSGISHSQESVNTSGGNASGTEGNVSYSVGQLTYNEYGNGTGSVAQGVQHAYEIVTLSVYDGNINIAVNAFPNPTTDLLMLSISNPAEMSISYELRDVNGKLLTEGMVKENLTSIDMQFYTPATYFINVKSNQQNIQSFKIIKN